MIDKLDHAKRAAKRNRFATANPSCGGPAAHSTSLRARLSILRGRQIDLLSIRNDSLILVVRANPKPISCVALDISQGAIIRVADANRPNFADFLEVERRQARIVKPKTKSFTRATTNRLGKFSVRFPESTVR